MTYTLTRHRGCVSVIVRTLQTHETKHIFTCRLSDKLIHICLEMNHITSVSEITVFVFSTFCDIMKFYCNL